MNTRPSDGLSLAPPGFAAEFAREDWGLVDFDVTADTLPVLTQACAMALQQNSHACHALVTPSSLGLYWTTPLPIEKGPSDRWCELVCPIKDADTLASLISAWLATQAYWGEPPDTDGDVRRGFRAWRSDYSQVLQIDTAWVVYGK